MAYFTVEIEMDSFEVTVSAKNYTDARIKAVARLKRKNATNLIKRDYLTGKRQIWIDENY